MRTILLLALALVTAAPQAPASRTLGSQWARYPLGGRFSVLLPSAPTFTRDESTSPQSGPYTTHIWVSKTDDEIYFAGWVDYQPTYNYGIQDEIRANRDNFVKGMNGRLTGSEAWNFGEYPGMEFTAEVPGNPNREIRSRIVIIGRRPYMIASITPVAPDRSASIYRFLSSFQIIDNR